jgi:hypothetical protein
MSSKIHGIPVKDNPRVPLLEFPDSRNRVVFAGVIQTHNAELNAWYGSIQCRYECPIQIVLFVINRNKNTQKNFEAGIDRNLKVVICLRVDGADSERREENQGNQVLDYRGNEMKQGLHIAP